MTCEPMNWRDRKRIETVIPELCEKLNALADGMPAPERITVRQAANWLTSLSERVLDQPREVKQ